MMDDNCIFCKLANGIFPTNFIYEDDDFKVILDADPATKGHSLVLPKSHAKNLLELDDALAAKAIVVAKKVAAQMISKLGCAGINIVQNNGEAAGQTVNHFHIHVIPRYEDDEDKTMCGWSHQKFTDEEIQKIKNDLAM